MRSRLPKVGLASGVIAGLGLWVSGCGDNATSSKPSPAPPPHVAAAVLLFKANGSLSSGSPALINLYGKVVARPAVRPAAGIAYDGAGALWIARGERSQRDYFTHGCDLWRTAPAHVVLTYKQAQKLAVDKGLAKASDKTHNLLCNPGPSSKGGIIDTWTPDFESTAEVLIALPPNADSAAEASAGPAPARTSGDDYSAGMIFPTWDGATLHVQASDPMGASSVTLERKDGSTQVLWTEGVGLPISEAQISRDGRWLFARAGASCGTCQPDLYRAPIENGPAGAKADGGPTLVLRHVQALTVPPPPPGKTVLPSASGGATGTTSSVDESTAAPAPEEILVSGADLPVDYTDMGESESSDGLSDNFVIPGDPCWPADLKYQVRYSAEQVLTGPSGATVSSKVMDLGTRERAASGLSMIRESGRGCATGTSGRPSLVGGGIAAKIEWHAPTAVLGDFTVVSTTLSQATRMDQILTHGGATYFTQGPYLIEIHALNMSATPDKVTDPLTLESDIKDTLATVVRTQADKIRAATGNRPS